MGAVVALFGLFFFALGFVFYGRFLEKVFEIDFEESTPAVIQRDGIDFYPTKWFVLFGHHFSSIAGAAPIIGPVLAISMWGWLGPYWWIILGSVFMGGMHDFGSLVVSMKYKAETIGGVSKEVISSGAKVVFSLFLFLALILIVAVFAFFAAKTFIASKEAVLPSLGLIAVAVFIGFLLYVRRWPLAIVTFIGIALLGILLVLGRHFPIVIDSPDAMPLWITALLVYALFASITPVQYLLQPRDYLSSYLLFFGLILGYIGLFLTRPTLHLPAFVSSSGQVGGKGFFPFLFVTIACGAISGFHSLVSSGTTARQISSYKDARKIAYGAMLAEGALALLTTIAVASAYRDIPTLLSAIKAQGPINAFATAYYEITKCFLGDWGRAFAVIMLNAFILTTLDTATRLGRYISQELFGVKNRIIAALFIIVPSAYLAISGTYQALWPIFGAANQLIAAIVLLVLVSYLRKEKKGKKAFWDVTLLPAVFMFAVTLSALYIGAVKYAEKGKWLLLSISIYLMLLSIIMIFEYIRTSLWKK